jgi:hypothetical protein
MFPFSTLLLILWLAMMDPCFVTSDDSVSEGIMVVTTVIQMFLADVQLYLFMQHCLLFRDWSCTDLVKPKHVVDDFLGRTVTNLQMICHIINCH